MLYMYSNIEGQQHYPYRQKPVQVYKCPTISLFSAESDESVHNAQPYATQLQGFSPSVGVHSNYNHKANIQNITCIEILLDD